MMMVVRRTMHRLLSLTPMSERSLTPAVLEPPSEQKCVPEKASLARDTVQHCICPQRFAGAAPQHRFARHLLFTLCMQESQGFHKSQCPCYFEALKVECPSTACSYAATSRIKVVKQEVGSGPGKSFVSFFIL